MGPVLLAEVDLIRVGVRMGARVRARARARARARVRVGAGTRAGAKAHRVGRGDVEKLGDYGCDAAEETRPRPALADLIGPLHVDVGGHGGRGGGRVHLGGGRREDHIDRRGLQRGQVSLPRRGVGIEVLVRRKLHRVQKDRGADGLNSRIRL